MYKPANIRQFVTPALHQRYTETVISGRTQKTYQTIGTIKGKFNQKGTAIINANGLEIVHDKMTFVTWWNNNIKAGDILEIDGIKYTIEGNPENVEKRSRYAVINLQLLQGGA